MKKRFLNLLLVLVMVAFVVPTWADAATKCWHDSRSKYCTVEKFEAKPATCTEDGYEAYYYCTFCKKEMKLNGTTYEETTKTVIPATGDHDYSDFVKMVSAATCTEARVDEYKCKTCDATMTKNNGNEVALDHDWNKGTVTEQATCTVDGLKTFACSRCDEVKTETIEAGHTWKSKTAADATCVTAGWKSGKACKVCGEPQYASNVIPATGEHDYSVFVKMVSPATCTEARVDEYKCKTCDATMTKNNGNEVALDHDWDKGTVTEQATCTVDGLKTFACSRCDEVKTETIEAGHTWKTKTAADATCVTAGWKSGKACKVCGEPQYASNVIPATGEHDYSVFVKMVSPATCTEARVDEYKCKTCDATMTKNNGNEVALTHDWDAGTKTRESTCQKYGLRKFTCTRSGCGETKTETIDKLTCNIETLTAKAPTCAATGLTEGVKCDSCKNGADCAHCATVVKAQTSVAKVPHVMEVIQVDTKPTCETDGYGRYDCKNCGYAYDAVIAKLNHDMQVEEVIREASCTKTSCTKFVCANEGCGLINYKEEAALGHTEDAILEAVPATCTATGLTEGKKCSVCNTVTVAQEATPMAEHTWETVEGKEASCTATGLTDGEKCSVCGAVKTAQQEIPKTAHTYVGYQCECGAFDPNHEHECSVVSTTPATCTEAGSVTRGCDDCAYEETETIPAKGHNYVNGKCDDCNADDPGHSHTYTQTGYSAPTCTVQGQVTKKCSVCNHEEQTIIDMADHSYSNGECSVCGADDPGYEPPCTHSNVTSTTREPTCARAGYTIETCADCGHETVTPISTTGNHTYVNGFCSVCNTRDPNRLTNDFQDVYIVG